LIEKQDLKSAVRGFEDGIARCDALSLRRQKVRTGLHMRANSALASTVAARASVSGLLRRVPMGDSVMEIPF